MITKNKERDLVIRRKRARDLKAMNYTTYQIACDLNCDVQTVYNYLKYWKHHDEMKAKLNGKKLSLKERSKDLV